MWRRLFLLFCCPVASEAPRAKRRLYNYQEVAKLTAADAAADDQFGRSVAIDGATIVVGAVGDDDGGSGSGSVYVFRTSDGGATYATTTPRGCAIASAPTTAATRAATTTPP